MDIMNVKELCQYLEISDSMARKLVREGSLKFFRIGNRINFRRLDIEEYVEKQCNKNYKGEVDV